jgi:hypothetical protein
MFSPAAPSEAEVPVPAAAFSQIKSATRNRVQYSLISKIKIRIYNNNKVF